MIINMLLAKAKLARIINYDYKLQFSLQRTL
jgi:hypothetical protein